MEKPKDVASAPARTELIWDGKYQDGKRVAPLRVALPFQTVETVNESVQERQKNLLLEAPGAYAAKEWRNRLIWGDKKYILPSLLPEFAGKVNLMYYDPPFNTDADFSFTASVPDHPDTPEDDSFEFTKEPNIIEQKAYRDTWGRGLESYLHWFYETIVLSHELLHETGTLYVHLDWHVGHYAKCVLDEVFGKENFINEIVRVKCNPKNYTSSGFGNIHDVIYSYAKSDEYTWNKILGPVTPEDLEEGFPLIEPKTNRRYTTVPLHAPAVRYGVTGKPWKGIPPPKGRHWAFVPETLDKFEREGRIAWSETGNPRLKMYADECPGYPIQDIWSDFKDTRQDIYATQKPEALLERIIKASSKPGDLVLDIFGGSGTTAVVAEKLGRRWITGDLGRFAIHTMRKRLLAIPDVRPFVVQNLGKYERQLWAGAEFGESNGKQAAARQRAYVQFILKLYNAKPIHGYTWLHGLHSGRMVHVGAVDSPVIIDYKKGSARRDSEGDRVAKEPDAMQVAAHALLLQEHGVKAVRGAIYYAADKRRVPVEFTEELFEKVRSTIKEARAVAASGKCPPPLKNDARCLYCSAYPICLPNETLWWARARADVAPEPQLDFGFVAQTEDALRDRILEAMEFAAETSGKQPPTLQPPRPEHDDGEVLVVQKAGAQIGVSGEELVVKLKDEVLRKLPGQQVRSIYLYGAVQLTAQAVSTCLELGIDVAYFSPAGRYLGALCGLPTSGVDARRGQYRLFELPGVRLQLAREVIRAKIHNQRVMLMRNGEVPERVLQLLSHFRDATEKTHDLTELLGVEGSAAALYFEQFDSMLKKREDWKFDWRGRNRRPPRDPVNALLSLGYSMLAKELTGVCHAVGVDPFLGFMHQPRYGRPALALDLMEEFRPLIADSVAISLVNRGELGPEDFIRSANGTFLNDRGRKVFWEAWFRRLDAEVTHPEFQYKMSYRRMLEVQARQLWRFVRGEAASYHGFTTR